MALHAFLQLSSMLRSAASLTLRRNIGLSAVVLNRAKELDPVQKLFLDKIRDYNTKSKLVLDEGKTFIFLTLQVQVFSSTVGRGADTSCIPIVSRKIEIVI